MKIVITVEDFDPDKGYLEYYLANELAELGHQVRVCTFGMSKHISRTKFDEGFEVITLPSIVTVNGAHLPDLNGIVYIIKFIKTEKPNLIHCQPLFSPLSLVFALCQRLSKYKIVGSLITGEYAIDSTTANLKYNLAKMVTEHYIRKKVASFFAINEGWKKIMLHLFDIPQEKIRIVPLGADSQLFKFDAEARTRIRNQLGLSDDDVIVVYSGKMIQQKNLPLLMEAIAPIIRQNRNVRLLLVGKGERPYVEYIKELCLDLGISNNVIFHPWVHRTKLPDFYSASDIAVWPGSVSISMIEAVSAGLPVIVKRSKTTKSVLAYENGFAFEQGNITELNECLRKMITDSKLRKDMGKKSRLLVEQKLNWKTITHQYLNTYKGIEN